MKRVFVLTLIVIAAVLALTGCGAGGGSTDPLTVVKTDEGAVSFAGTIQPMLIDHCNRCHGKESEGELSILSYASVMQGGKSGPIVVAGDPDGSRIISSVEKTKPPHMPPRIFPALTEDRIQALRQWIAEGAEDN
jgi:hypothetical protein